MALEVFDFRTDVKNLVITPEIRSRFMRMEPGEVAIRHSHDLGHEIFLVLEGQAEFEIEGERSVLGPGQLCFARRDEMHQVRNAGEGPMTMYLSVTPHIDPTHTMWDEQGNKLPFRYGIATVKEDAARTEPAEPVRDVADRHVAAARALAAAAQTNVAAQESGAEALVKALEAGDRVSVRAAVDAMWPPLFRTWRALLDLSESWNELAREGGLPPEEQG